METKKVVGSIKREIDSIASKLIKISTQKELWYKKAIELKNTLRSLIGKIKILKSKKDVSNVKVKEYKEERDKYNKKVNELIKQIKELNKEKTNLIKKCGIKFDPTSLKEQIEKLELKIQTDAINFEKEKKIMEEIKRLKRIYGEGGAVKEVVDKINNISKEIDEARNKAEEYHKRLKEYFKESKDYNEFIELSKQIDEVKKQQENAFNTFRLLKKEYEELNGKIDNKKEEKVRKQKFVNERKKQFEDKLIEEKAKQVEEKLKTKKKLTTQDLLVLQGKEDKDELN